MASKHPIIRLRVYIHLTVGHFMVPPSEQAVVVYHGAEVVAESLAAVEGFVGGKAINCMGAFDGTQWGSIKISLEASPED
jgi:hypothetical protein